MEINLILIHFAIMTSCSGHNNAVFFPPCQQKRVVQDVHPGCLMLLLDACCGQEVFCMFLLYFQSLTTFVSASFCCGNCWVCSPQCWESMVGQALYRLVFFDFLFLLLGSFFGEFLSKWVLLFCFVFLSKRLMLRSEIIIVSLLQPDWAKAAAEFGCSGV